MSKMLLSGSEAHQRYFICQEATALIQEIITIVELIDYNWGIAHKARDIEFLAAMHIMQGSKTKVKIIFSFNFDGELPGGGYHLEFGYLQLMDYKNKIGKLFNSHDLEESAVKIREYLARL